MAAASSSSDPPPRSGLLEFIERAGNRLPDPTTLFLIGTLVVMGLSEIAARGGWEVRERLPRQKTQAAIDEEGRPADRPVLGPDGRPQVEWVETGKSFTAVSLLTRDGLFWAIRSLVPNLEPIPKPPPGFGRLQGRHSASGLLALLLRL